MEFGVFGIFKKRSIHDHIGTFLASSRYGLEEKLEANIKRDVARGMDINEVSADGDTALVRLFNANIGLGADTELIKLLVSCGANPMLPADRGENLTILEALTQTSDALPTSAQGLKMFLLVGAMLERSNAAAMTADDGSNLLHIVCRSHLTEGSGVLNILMTSIRALNDKPQLMNALSVGRDRNGDTPLQKLWQGALHPDSVEQYSHTVKQMGFWHAHKSLVEASSTQPGHEDHMEAVLDLASQANEIGFPFLWEQGEAVLAQIQARDIQDHTPAASSRPSRRF